MDKFQQPQHIKYLNIVKALLHSYKDLKYFSTEYCFKRNDEYLKMELFSDSDEISFHVSIDASNGSSLLKIRVIDYIKLNSMHQGELDDVPGFCNINNNETHETLNYVEMDSNKVNLYHRKIGSERIDMSTLEEDHFQLSTVKEIEDIESFYYMRDMYNVYNEFVPMGVGVMNKYNCTYDLNPEFIEFVTSKLWGMVALTK